MSELGICSTCNHLDLCASQKNWIAPKIHCEEFDDSPPHQETSGGRSSEPFLMAATPPQKLYDTARATPSKTHDEQGPYTGLCINCDSREYCALQTSDRVVWHCEEWKIVPLGKLVPETLLPPFGVKPTTAAKKDVDREPFKRDINVNDMVNVINKHGTDRGGLIAILEEVQSIYGYLPEKAMRLLCD